MRFGSSMPAHARKGCMCGWSGCMAAGLATGSVRTWPYQPAATPPAAGQLLRQQLVEPQFGWPPALLAKGEGVVFTAGAPLAVTGPEVSGLGDRASLACAANSACLAVRAWLFTCTRCTAHALWRVCWSQVPGFTRRIAAGLFGQPGYTCNGTLT